MPVGSPEGANNSEGPVEADWHDVGNNAGWSTSSPPLQTAPGVKDKTSGLPAPLHYRQLQELKIRHLKETQSFKATVSLTEEWKIELQ